MKCNQPRLGFELVSPCPFPMTITITPRAPPNNFSLAGISPYKRSVFFFCFFGVFFSFSFRRVVRSIQGGDQEIRILVGVATWANLMFKNPKLAMRIVHHWWPSCMHSMDVSQENPSIIGISPSYCLLSYSGYSFGESYPFAEMQSVYSAASADWATRWGSLTPLQSVLYMTVNNLMVRFQQWGMRSTPPLPPLPGRLGARSGSTW